MDSNKFSTSPVRLDGNKGEKPLSPVLQKKRFSRKYVSRKSSKRLNEQEEPIVKPHKQRNSCIPIPIKDHTQHITHNDVQATSSSSLTNFKQEVITKCANTHLGRSEHAKYHDTNVETKLPKNYGMSPKRNPQILYQNTDAHCASGDVSKESVANEHFESHSKKNKLDMLYENTHFEMTPGSRSTMNGSLASEDTNVHTVKVFCNNNFQASDSSCSRESMMKYSNISKSPRSAHQCIQEEDIEKEHVTEESKPKCVLKGLSHDKITLECNPTSKNSVNINITASMEKEMLKAAPFMGFSKDEIEQMEQEFASNRLLYNKITHSKKESKTEMDCEGSKNMNFALCEIPRPSKILQCVALKDKTVKEKSQNKIIINGVENSDTDSLAVSPNNRVQISIGHNRIRINIKPENSVSNKKFEDICLSPIPALTHVEQAKASIAEISDESEEKMPTKKKEHDSYEYSSGFKSASSNMYSSLRKLESNADEIIQNGTKPQNMDISCGSFKSAAGNVIQVNTKYLKKAALLFENLDSDKLTTTSGDSSHPANSNSMPQNFTRVTSPHSSEVSANVSQLKTDVESVSVTESERKILKPKYTLPRGTRSATTDSTKTSRKSLFSDEMPDVQQFGNMPNFNFDFKSGFASASGKKNHIDEKKLKEAMNKFKDIDDSNEFSENIKPENYEGKDREGSPFSYQSTNQSILSINSTAKSKVSEKTAHELIEECVNTHDRALKHFNSPKRLDAKGINDVTPLRPSGTRKRLGISRIKCQSIRKEQLDKARMLFEDIDKPLAVPVPFSPSNRFQSPKTNTPFVKRPSFSENNVSNTSTPRSEKNVESLEVLNFTPIKNTTIQTPSALRTFRENEESILVFHEKSCSNFKELQNDIDIEYMNLKRKLDVLGERKKAIEQQKFAIENSEHEHRKPKFGILTRKKMNAKTRINLSDLNHSTEDNLKYFHIDQKIFEITPKNAEKMHFNFVKNEYRAVFRTSDGAVVIPNTQNTIGVSEINNAFQAMSGIDPRLIPKGWVSNHYKWIVWKLASYERRFPQYFKDYLSIDNIMQQLKYRYDKEIDQAQRPALRRIMEKDDVAGKRIVLCVADIIQVCTNKFELILSDGWYGIRTMIDSLLCQQIYKNKLTVGTKLIIQGAELLDCEGCHPLEAPEHIKLKIGYNSTRRAKWHTKLGYYKNQFPFAISLRTIHPYGGIVPCIKVYIVRVYPVRYMEEYNGIKIWRNHKAEEKRAREFDLERMKELDKIKHDVLEQYEGDLRKKNNQTWDKHSLSGITCARTLYQIMEGTSDPEYVYNMLNSQQKSLVMEYKLNAASERQREIAQKMTKQIDALKLNQRCVTPVLKLLVTDSLEESSTCVMLNVWRPTEEQILMFKEECCMSIYNVTIRKTNELNTGYKTLYKPHDDLNIKTFQRQLLPISMTTDPYYKPMFNEFDTIGIIIETKINNFDQDLWLADFVGRLLYVKIVDGPKICSLIDHVKVGQVVAVCNLLMQLPHAEFGQAVANQFSIVSQFPQQKFLQNGIELFNAQLNNSTKLINESKLKIESLRGQINLRPNTRRKDSSLMHKTEAANITTNTDDSLDENASIPSRLTLTDVAMSMLDTDQFM